MSDSESIVRDLAANNPVDFHRCTLCLARIAEKDFSEYPALRGSVGRRGSGMDRSRSRSEAFEITHVSTCPWQRAVNYVRLNDENI